MNDNFNLNRTKQQQHHPQSTKMSLKTHWYKQQQITNKNNPRMNNFIENDISQCIKLFRIQETQRYRMIQSIKLLVFVLTTLLFVSEIHSVSSIPSPKIIPTTITTTNTKINNISKNQYDDSTSTTSNWNWCRKNVKKNSNDCCTETNKWKSLLFNPRFLFGYSKLLINNNKRQHVEPQNNIKMIQSRYYCLTKQSQHSSSTLLCDSTFNDRVIDNDQYNHPFILSILLSRNQLRGGDSNVEVDSRGISSNIGSSTATVNPLDDDLDDNEDDDDDDDEEEEVDDEEETLTSKESFSNSNNSNNSNNNNNKSKSKKEEEMIKTTCPDKVMTTVAKIKKEKNVPPAGTEKKPNSSVPLTNRILQEPGEKQKDALIPPKLNEKIKNTNKETSSSSSSMSTSKPIRKAKTKNESINEIYTSSSTSTTVTPRTSIANKNKSMEKNESMTKSSLSNDTTSTEKKKIKKDKKEKKEKKDKKKKKTNQRVLPPIVTNEIKSRTNPNYRIQKELKSFLMDPPPNLKVTVGSNIRVWIVTMKGVGIYTNEIFRLRISFPNNYPTVPPSVYFLPPNIPVHEHVYTNGDICLSLLGKDWRPTMTGQSIAVSILSILSSATSKTLPMDNSRHAHNQPGQYQKDWVYHDDNC